jgi:hypothetical protein
MSQRRGSADLLLVARGAKANFRKLLTHRKTKAHARYWVELPPDREEAMRKVIIGALASLVAMTLSTSVFAQGTEAEAKAMLTKAVAAVKTDQAKAIDMFNKGEGGFLDRDLYVFCSSLPDGKIVALGNQNAKQMIGTNVKALKDSTGKMYGEELLTGELKPEGQITTVGPYMFPRPGADKTPVQKFSFVTKASADLGCGVGYYK